VKLLFLLTAFLFSLSSTKEVSDLKVEVACDFELEVALELVLKLSADSIVPESFPDCLIFASSPPNPFLALKLSTILSSSRFLLIGLFEFCYFAFIIAFYT
jgi:hypothetical protein